MPFTVATLEELIEFGKYLAINYKTERAQMDRNRFLGSFSFGYGQSSYEKVILIS